MFTLTEAAIQALGGVFGVAFLTTALWGHSRWTAHTAPSLVRLLVALSGSSFLFAVTAPHPSMYQIVWLYTLLGVPVVFTVFCFEYYGLDLLTTPGRLAAFISPALLGLGIGTILSLNTGSAGAGGRLLTPVMQEQMGGMGGEMSPEAMQAPISAMFGGQTVPLPEWVIPVGLAVQELSIYYVSGVTLIASALLIGSVVRYRHLDTGLGVTLAFVGLWPWAVYVFMPAITSVFSWDAAITAITGGYVASFAAVGIAVGRYRVFESQPAAGNIGATTVLNELDNPVFVLDQAGTVLRLNAAAAETFGIDDRNVVGQSLTTVLGTDVTAASGGDRLELDTTDGYRQFEVMNSSISGHTDTVRGKTVLLQDVTQRRARQQRLQVLNRVLRHNLRNDISVIRGRAEIMSDGGTQAGGPGENADVIRKKSEELLSISERAREAQQILASDREPTEEADIGRIVSSVHQDVSEAYPEAELSAAIPDEVIAAVDGTTLEIVLSNLVENACEHNDTETPVVTTSVEQVADGMIRLLVRDNGPGIPDMERSVIETGAEDPLEHSNAMGLWTVKWGVARMGGVLSFDENTPRGTVVQLEIPVAKD